MKVLLVNPPWWNKPKSLWSGISGVLPPLGPGYLASMLLKNNIDGEILDLNAFQQPPEAIGDFLKNNLCLSITNTVFMGQSDVRNASLSDHNNIM